MSPIEQPTDQLIFYNSESGLTAVGNIDSSTGALQTLAAYYISPGWSIITQLPEGNQAPWELFYN